jgi:hypothetical protein
MKDTPRHITWEQLPEPEKFMKLPSSRRRLLNTVGMIVYRAETAMASLMENPSGKFTSSDARTILQDLFTTPADILPDAAAKTLNIRLHGASTPAANRRLADLFAQINQTETVFPGTDMTMVFHMMRPSLEKSPKVPPNLPRDQDI